MALLMAMSYEPQASQVNEELPPKSSLNLTLTHHPCDEDPSFKRCAVVLKLNPLKLGTIVFI
jgi:hypothetical protein